MYLTLDQKQCLIYASFQLEQLSKLAPRYIMTEEIQNRIISALQPVSEVLIDVSCHNEKE